jgi:cellobiose phosphorylase
MKKSTDQQLWEFTDPQGSFRFPQPDEVSRLYFPLANEGGILSSITPELQGDIKTGHNTFLTPPISVEDLYNTKSSRNFWAYVEGKGAWSLTGVSASQRAGRHHGNAEKVTLEAGMLWHKVMRESASWKLRSEIINFAPVGSDRVEIMMVTLTNTSTGRMRVSCTSGVPIFGRSADNLRDHNHVTSLLHRVLHHPAGVVVKPTMSFDERGHKINQTSYAVLGFHETGELPEGTFPTVNEYIGEGGDLEAPRSVLENWPIPQKNGYSYQGKSAVGALRFKEALVLPGKSLRFVLLMGIAQDAAEIDAWMKKYGSWTKAEQALRENKAFWDAKVDALKFQTQDASFNGWMRWVCLQPTLRKIFGCSFLPDFDYGRGGRGWRDLWQDCLALLLTSAAETRPMLLHNFNGVRIDGSNATIIGSDGSLIADRNNITRVWMDHGVWPWLTTELYLHQTGDVDILFENARYFRDKQMARARKKDAGWSEADGSQLKTRSKTPAEGTVLEHILVQHLVQFFNVGDHGHIRLENADWNDGLDMAYDKGESVAFTCLYASNLKKIADTLDEVAKKKGLKKVSLAKELLILLDRAAGQKKVKYDSPEAKRKTLEKYFEAVQPVISGTKREVMVKKLTADLREKAAQLSRHVQTNEWTTLSGGDAIYNGYYDNLGRKVEGDFPKGVRMTLAGQTFPVMGGVATLPQVREIFKSARKYLKDREHNGFRLNTDFHEIRPDLGRAFSFAYGEKENGAFFSHMAVMFGNALYQRGFASEGREVLQSIYRMATRTDKSRIYPGIPEYFNSSGRGLYHYLTGSASWYVLTLLTQVFGLRGQYGDLLLAPKLTREDFLAGPEVSVEAHFAGQPLKVVYVNAKKLSYEHYSVSRVSLNGKDFKEFPAHQKEVLIPKAALDKAAKRGGNVVRVTLE